MHVKVAQIIEHPVVGEIVSDGQALWVGAWGRVCLERVGKDELHGLKQALEREGVLDVRQVSLLGPATSPDLPGLVALELRHPELPQPYTLQVGTPALFELLERRFWLASDVLADLAGAYLAGLRPLAASGGNTAFGRVARLDELGRRFDENLVRAGQGGPEAPPDEEMGYLVDSVQRAAGLLPWTLRKRMITRWLPPRPVALLHLNDEGADLPILLAALRTRDGQVAKQQIHRQNPQVESVEQVENLALEVLQLKQEFRPPDFLCVAARASSLAQLLDSFPRHRPPFGSTPEFSQ